MAGDLTAEIQDAEIRAAWDRLRLRMAPAGMRSTLAAIGRYGKSSTQLRFRSQVGPNGKSWPKSKRVLKHGGQTLRLTSRLRNSIEWDASSDAVSWGTNVKYAAVHQGGLSTDRQFVPAHSRKITIAWGRKVKNPRAAVIKSFARRMIIPARPYLGLNEADRRAVLVIMASDLST